MTDSQQAVSGTGRIAMFSRSVTVTGADGRIWRVRRNIEPTLPNIGDDSEHNIGSDVVGSGIGVVVFVAGTCGFWFWIFRWFPASEHIPLWIKVAAVTMQVLLVAVLPARWLLLRSYYIVAETGFEEDDKPERWSGLVRGRGPAREETELIARAIRTTSSPYYESGAMYDTSAPFSWSPEPDRPAWYAELPPN